MLKKIFLRYVLNNSPFNNTYSKLNLLYLINDPWQVKSSPGERYRFLETNRLIQEYFGRNASLLEIGCGEGHQSIYLGKVCDRLVGLDVSARAVDRARQRFPAGKFIVGDIFTKELDSIGPFDLIVASEVLYYMEDISAALQRIQELGNNYLITYFARKLEILDPYILSLPGVKSDFLEFENIRWRIAWWSKKNIMSLCPDKE
ncbi:MAG: class I SAM-dependent methyltransferase [Thermodesulfobacteriota bacterium]